MNNPSGWYYFGCAGGLGHYLYDENLQRFYMEGWTFDGMLFPRNAPMYTAYLTRLGAWKYSVLSFKDSTMDKRPGSNSNFFAPYPLISPETIWSNIQRLFPTIYERLPKIDLTPAMDYYNLELESSWDIYNNRLSTVGRDNAPKYYG